MRTSISTTVAGNATSCRLVADWLARVSPTTAQTADALYRERTESESGWVGLSGDACRRALSDLGKRADHIVDAASHISPALYVFADELDTVHAQMAHIRSRATELGVPTTPTTIEVDAVGCAVPPAAAVEEVSRLAAAARDREHHAHAALEQALRPFVSFTQYLAQTAPMRSIAIGRSSYTKAINGKVIGRSAAVNKRVANAALAVAQNSTNSSATRAAISQYVNQRALFDAKVAFGQATVPAQRVLSKGATFFDIKIADNKPVPVKIPYSSGLFSAAGAGWSIMHGAPADKTVTSTAAGLASSTLTTAGVEAGLVAAGMAAGPAGWIALGAGFAVSAGVGYMIDHHWNGIKHALHL